MEVVTISYGKNPAFMDQHFWNILQKNPEQFNCNFYQKNDEFIPRAVTFCNADDIGPTPWGLDLPEIDQQDDSQIINNQKPLSDYHQNYFKKSSEIYNQAYAQSGALLYTAWQNNQLNFIEDARVKLNNIQLPTDFMENKRTFIPFTDFDHEKVNLLDNIRIQLEKCDSIDTFFMFQEPDYQSSQLEILDFLSQNTPKTSIFVYDIDHSEMKFKQIYQSKFQYDLNDFSTHGVLVRQAQQDVYQDSSISAIQLAQFIKKLSTDKYEIDNILRGIQTSPIQNLLKSYQVLEGDLNEEVDLEDMIQNSFSSVLLKDEKVNARHNRWLQIQQADIELSDTFPFLFKKILGIDWRTQVRQEQLLYNGKQNKTMLDSSIDLFQRVRQQLVFGIDEDQYQQSKEFILNQYEAYGGCVDHDFLSDSE
ncbi:hypothetical protein SS50377_22386 [Spironucleus salmonicida]|uniref:Uncharacterized protein n=1 Tax=Spironucleus salmonicida TaxID=348837 RepID=V6LN23_9EUKA|nr:hypothetical protein SS50377_22386 [Spironucleus salmonicida]|eukprot:EST42119.1 hypothetical protein SS50377_18428 [Spironucleus salmonicida]